MIGFKLHYALKEIMGRKNRSLLMLAGLTLGVTFLLCVNALAGAYEQAAVYVELKDASTWERVGEFGTMKALGWTRRDIRRALMLELFSQVLIGVVLGLGIAVIGSLLAGHWQVNISPVGSAPPLPGMAPTANTIKLPVVFPASLYLSALGASLLVGFLVAVTVVRKVSAIKPAEAWRHL